MNITNKNDKFSLHGINFPLFLVLNKLAEKAKISK